MLLLCYNGVASNMMLKYTAFPDKMFSLETVPFRKIQLNCAENYCIQQYNNTYVKTSMKGTMDPEGSARNSCYSWPLYAQGKT